MIRQLYSLRKF